MANFPPFQYQPQMPPFGQQMQYFQQPQQEQSMFCRMVTSRDEVQACPVDFSGRPMTFIHTSGQTIWTKVFDPNTGGSVVAEFRKADPAAVPETVTMKDFEQLMTIVRQQGEEIERLKASRRRSGRETEDVTDAL